MHRTRLAAVVLLTFCILSCASSHDVESRSNDALAEGSRSRGRPPDDPARIATGHAAQSSGGDPGDYVFSQEAVRHYAVEVDAAQWADLKEHAYLEQYIPARVTFEGETYGPIGIRFKGFRGSLYNCFDFDASGQVQQRTCERMPIKLSFDEYDEDGRFFGLKKLNFHAMRNDPSLLRERISYFVFRAFGVPAPRAVHATLSINGEDEGLFSLVEQPDGRFARNAFQDGGGGNIYKERWPMTSTDPEYFASGLESNRDVADVSAMLAFAEDLQGATDATIEGVLREHTHFEALLRYLAVDRALNHWDGPLAFRCRPESEVPPLPPEVEAAQRPPLGWEVCQNKNYYWYEAADSGRLQLVPWDMDVTWNSFSQFPDWNTEPRVCEVQQQGRPPRCDKLIDQFATTLRPHYVAAGVELLTTGPLHADLLGALANRWYAQIAPHASGPVTVFGALLLNREIDGRIRAFEDEIAH